MLKLIASSGVKGCRVTAPTTRPAWSLIFGFAAVGVIALASEARANAPNIVMLLGASPYMIATVPVTIAIEAAAIRWMCEISWGKSVILACVNYLASTSLGSFIGGGIMFGIHPIFFGAGHTFYVIVNTVIFSLINTAIEIFVLVLIFRLSMRWRRFAVFYAANLVTTGLLFIP